MSRRQPRLTRREVLASAVGLGAGAAAAAAGLSAATGRTSQAPAIRRSTSPQPAETPVVATPAEEPQPPLEILWTALRQRRTTPCRLVFAGSSTTAGASASDAAHRFVTLIADALQVAHPSGTGVEWPVQTSPSADFGVPSAAAGVHVYNAGEGGTRSSDYLRPPKIERVAGLRPAAVVHMIGANDFRTNVTPDAYRSAMAQSLGTLRELSPGPCVHVLVHSYQPVDAPARSARHPWAAYGEVLRDLAEREEDSVFIDLSESYRRLGVPGDDPLSLLSPDRLHQTDTGHALMAELLLRELRPR
ncbi:SGNH/GDSL hydrolase family protein [Modestobacter sp. SYSU DS0657]